MIEYDAAPSSVASAPPRDIKEAMLRGWRQSCPACGEGTLFRKYLKVADTCPTCREELYHHRADDAPPYFTMVIVGHVVIGGILMVEKAFAPPSWVHLVMWLPLTVIMSLILLPRVKGALIGLQWALRMHGFSGVPDAPMPDPSAR
ncbi:DUF983 domain-containing protein [Hyphomicrobium sp.]|uniref:DUF983 domain-containing protein n=1 Tax=Hyphomicrobium sp. TaxID=82 RepID=UPI002FDE335A